MKRIFLIIAIFLCNQIQINAQMQDVGIAKYAVLEVLGDNTPLREKGCEKSNRVTHVFKDAVLFADKQTDDYFRVELNENNYAWINKKFVEVQAIIPEKRFDNIEKISFKSEKKFYKTKIETPSQSAFLIKEEGNNLDFTLFDNRYDTIETSLEKNDKFLIPEKITNELNIK